MMKRPRAVLCVVLVLHVMAGVCTLRAQAPATPSAKTPDRVFLLIGQSNMAGRAELGPDDLHVMEGVFLLNAQGKWEPATNPLNRYSSDRKGLDMQRLSPGYAFAKGIRASDPDRTVGLIVNARGGSPIELWAKGKQYYENTMKRIAGLGEVRIAGVLWHQGESNARDPEYLEKLVALVHQLRRDLEAPDLPFVAGEIADPLPVNAAMRQLPTRVKNTAVVKAEDLKKFDQWHFDRASQLTLGRRYADAWLELVKEK